MRLRLLLAFAAALLVALLAFPLLRDRGARRERIEPRAALPEMTEPVAPGGDREDRPERAPATAPKSVVSRPRSPAQPSPPQPATLAAVPDIDFAALGLTDPRTGVPPVGAADRSPTTTAPAAPGFDPKAFAKRVAEMRDEPSDHPYPAPDVTADLDLSKLGLTDPQLPAWWKELDADRDGKIGRDEWTRAGRPAGEFERLDRNGDGLLTAEEYRRSANAPPVRK